MNSKHGLVAGSLLALFATALHAQDVDLEAGDTAGPDAPAGAMSGAGWFSHGYIRAGVGSTDDDPMVAFKLDGAATKYRLGNESDVYGEFSLGFRQTTAGGSDLVAEVMLNGWGDSNAFNYGLPAESDGDVAQAYFGIERLGDGATAESFLWAGRRYYRRRDVHITDFYYENLSGDGIGLENVSLGNSALSTAFFYYDDDDITYESYALDVRVHDIALGAGWMGEIGFAYIDGSGADQSGDDGYSLRFHLETTDLAWGEMRNAFMYGEGAGIEFDSKGNPAASSGDNRFRFVNQTLIKSSEDLETQATAVWQRTRMDGETETWLSAGIRPQYNITKDWGVALEVGYDWVDPENGDSRSLTKATLAPFYSFGNKGFFARPQLRAFVTWAQWSDEGAITDQASLGNGTDATTFGVQLEHWW